MEKKWESKIKEGAGEMEIKYGNISYVAGLALRKRDGEAEGTRRSEEGWTLRFKDKWGARTL